MSIGALRSRRCGALRGLVGSTLHRLVVAAVILTVALALGSTALAAVPDRINFQGILESEEALFTGDANLAFAIYPDSVGGTPVWSRAAASTPVRDGLYAVQLGPFPGGALHDPAWLEVTVNGVALQPRYRLESVPFAFRSAEADRVAAAGVDGSAVRDGSLTAADLAIDVVSSLNGVANDGGNIDLVAGANIVLTPNDAENTVTIAARIDDGVTRIEAGAGLIGSDPTAPAVTLRVGAGSGIAVSDDAVAVDVAALAGPGLAAVEPTRLGISGNAVTAEMIAPAVVSSISGISHDGGDIELVGGANVVVTPDPVSHRITISAVESGYLAKIRSGGGLVVSEGAGPIATVTVTAGDGILVEPTGIAVEAADLAGAGLRADGTNNLEVEPTLLDGSAHDARFVNEGQAGSISAAMLVPEFVGSLAGVSNDEGNIDLAAGHAVTISPSDEDNTITFAVDGATLAGSGLVADEQASLAVNPGTGLEVAEDALRLDAEHRDGSAYEARFVSHDESSSVSAGMIVPDVVSSINGVHNDGGAIDLSMGTGLAILVSDDDNLINLALTEPYGTGSVYDDRFVNEGQEISIDLDMLTINLLSSIDGVINDGGNVDLVAGDNTIITPDDANNRVTIGTDTAGLDARFVNEGGAGTIPVGGIVMWSGSVGSIPAGWALCDGSTVSGQTTPDLRGRFVLAAGSGSGLTPRSVGQTGGEESHTLTVGEMPSHDHAVSDWGHSHSVSDPGHSHNYWDPMNGSYAGLAHDENGTAVEYPAGSATSSSQTGISLNTAYTGIAINSRGGGGAHNNMPPYYVLAFIMRVQ